MRRIAALARHFLLGLILLLGQIVAACTLPIAMRITPEPTATPTPIVLPQRDESAGVITAVQGNVLVQTVGARTAAVPFIFQLIGYGTTLLVAADSSITVVCYNDHIYQISEAITVTLLPENCLAGHPLPVGSADQLTPQNGRIHLLDGSKIAEGETRTSYEDLGLLPIVLTPRNTKLLTATATIAWSEASGALRYELRLLGSAPVPPVVVSPEELSCVSTRATAPYRICSIGWPSTWILTPDSQYFLIVSALTGIGKAWVSSDDITFWTLAEAEHNKVAATLDELQALANDATTQGLLAADTYIENGLFHAAIEQYQTMLIDQPSVVSLIALGDLYLEIDLPFFAIATYQDALMMLEDEPGQAPIFYAAINLGMGLAHYKQQQYLLAEPYFLQAVELYTAANATAEAESARQQLLKTQARLPPS